MGGRNSLFMNVQDVDHMSPSQRRLWHADLVRPILLRRLVESVKASQVAGIRPRLVIFDYLDSPVAHQLRYLAQELSIIVGVEAIERYLPSSGLRDRFRLLEKSKGVHGIFFPCQMTAEHRTCLAAHPELGRLNIDQGHNGFSPQVISFLQLAAAHQWNPAQKSVAILYSDETWDCAERLCAELLKLEMRVQLVSVSAASTRNSAGCDLLWLCQETPVELCNLHISRETVVIDSGRAFELRPSLTLAQLRVLPHRVRALCPAEGGLAPLVHLNRLHRLMAAAQPAKRANLSKSQRWAPSRKANL